MRRLLLTLLISSMFLGTCAQSMQEKLYYTCKVWGFVKYYHSEVSVCNVNWDSVLLDVLPDVRAAANSTQFNDALMHMINAAGPMAIAPGSLPDTIPVELKRNRDWTFITSPTLRADVQAKLNLIKDNFRPHPGCWIGVPPTSPSGYFYLPHDDMMLDVNTVSSYPDTDHRLLMFFKWWNLVRYFNPYNYVLDVPWDTTLYNYAVPISNVNNSQGLWHLVLKVAKALDDAHVYGLTKSYWETPPGYHMPKILLKYASGEYVVMRSLETGVNKGDILVSVDGKPVSFWEDSLRQYYSSGNEAVFKRTVRSNILRRSGSSIPITIVTKDADGSLQTHTVSSSTPNLSHPFFSTPYFPIDTLNSMSWTTLPCDIGYVNMGKLTQGEVNLMYNDLKNKEAIVFDLRNYPNNTLTNIANQMYPTVMQFEKAMLPDVSYPGTYYWSSAYRGISGNPDAYSGKVIILIDEGTQSQGEYTCMAIERMPGATKVGSQTAGANGNITQWSLTQDMTSGFSSLGIFYPDEDSTQRIGIVPDSVVTPTALGIRQGRDEVLERALGIAGCELFLKTPKINKYKGAEISVYPNPAHGIVKVHTNQPFNFDVKILITDVLGQTVIQKNSLEIETAIDIADLPQGIYFVRVSANGNYFFSKLAIN